MFQTVASTFTLLALVWAFGGGQPAHASLTSGASNAGSYVTTGNGTGGTGTVLASTTR